MAINVNAPIATDAPKSAQTYSYGNQASLGIEDFTKLLAAQMANQDPLEPMSNTEYIAQLAQFSSLEMQTNMLQMQENSFYLTNASYATSMIGKEVTVAYYDKEGKLQTKEGTISGIAFEDSSIYYMIDGEKYQFSNIMQIGGSGKADPVYDEDGNLIEPEEEVEPIEEALTYTKFKELLPDLIQGIVAAMWAEQAKNQPNPGDQNGETPPVEDADDTGNPPAVEP